MKKCVFIFNLLIVLFYTTNVFALEVCKPSSEYLKWLSLGDERVNYEMPNYCETKKAQYRAGLNLYSSNAVYPNKYSSVERGYTTNIKNQAHTNSCWTFASNSVLETNALKNGLGKFNFSEKHMEYSLTRYPYVTNENELGLNRALDAGGNTFLAASYYYRFSGPVDASLMPDTDTNELINYGDLKTAKPILLIDNYEYSTYNRGICSTDVINNIKEEVLNNGSIAVALYMETNSLNNGKYYYYNGDELTNHAVNIVGWDDTISKSNFKNNPSRDGAWIVRNSWGESFGEKGYFYVSYDDINICTNISVFSDLTVNDYDYGYYATPGISNLYFYNNPEITEGVYISSKFTKKSSKTEYLDRVSIEVLEGNQYTVYLATDNNLSDKTKWILLGSGSATNFGVKTIKFEKIAIDSDYTIIVNYKTTSDYLFSVACKNTSNEGLYRYLDINTNTNYYSIDGVNWNDLGLEKEDSGVLSYNGCSSVIFAYTKEKKEVTPSEKNITINSIQPNVSKVYVKTNDYYTVNITTSNINDYANITQKVYNSNNQDVTSNFVISGITNNSVTIKFNESVTAGKYKYVIKYENIEKSIEFNIYNVIESGKYQINNNIIIINLDNKKSINKATFNSNINTNGVAYTILDKNNQVINDNAGIGTNYSLKIGNYTYKLIILGDVYGDGVISAFDYIKIKNHMMGKKITDSNELIAADIYKDSKISAFDYITIKKIIMEA